MIQAFIKIRFKQLYRITKGIGLFRFLFLLFVSGFFVLGLFLQTAKTPNTYYISGIYLACITIIQINRKDKRFLKTHFPNYKLILAAEYSILLIPLLFCLGYYNHWIIMLSTAAISLVVLHLDFSIRKKSINTAIQRLIPTHSFEWKSGIRKTFFLIIPVWIAGLVLSFFIGSVPIALFILGIIPLSFYDKCEPLSMILALELGSAKFLLHKIKTLVLLFTILSVPLIIVFVIFHPEYWYIPLIQCSVFLFIHIYFILTKYAFYKPNQKSSPSQAFSIIGSMSILFFFLIPLIWILSIYFYLKSRKNLNFYLHDYN